MTSRMYGTTGKWKTDLVFLSNQYQIFIINRAVEVIIGGFFVCSEKFVFVNQTFS